MISERLKAIETVLSTSCLCSKPRTISPLLLLSSHPRKHQLTDFSNGRFNDVSLGSVFRWRALTGWTGGAQRLSLPPGMLQLHDHDPVALLEALKETDERMNIHSDVKAEIRAGHPLYVIRRRMTVKAASDYGANSSKASRILRNLDRRSRICSSFDHGVQLEIENRAQQPSSLPGE